MSTNYQSEPPIFFKHLPPPNMIHCYNHHSVQHQLLSTEQLFEQNVHSFMSNRQKNKEFPTNQQVIKLKLNEIKNDFININETIEHLKANENNLRQNINKFTTVEWTQSLQNLHEKQKSIELLLAKYENPLQLQKIRKIISQRKNQRSKLKHLQAQRKQHKIDIENNRQKLHQQIDAWQSKQISNEIKRKEMQQNSKRVPEILGGVTKKKLEAKKYLAVLDSLIDLRHARCVQSGKMPKIGENFFIERINRLKAVWIDALENYENDENELKKFLDTNEQTIECDWNRVLFNVGNSGNVKNPLLKANYNLNDFILMRYVILLICIIFGIFCIYIFFSNLCHFQKNVGFMYCS